jgi:uncharacterized protein (DUF305 family)
MNTDRFIKPLSIFTVMLLACLAFNVNAQQVHAMPGMSATTAADDASSPATQAFKAGEAQMMSSMSAPAYTGNADKDFVAHMIPHHQGAVTMARIELKYGKDPAIKKLARNIIQAQNKEIAFMKKWQTKSAKP